MSVHHVVDAILHAALWRGMHTFSPLMALGIAAAAILVGVCLKGK